MSKKGYKMGKRGVTVDDHHEAFKQGRNAGSYPSQARIEAAGHEMKKSPPAALAKTRRKRGKKAADRQRVAIMLSKARRGG